MSAENRRAHPEPHHPNIKEGNLIILGSSALTLSTALEAAGYHKLAVSTAAAGFCAITYGGYNLYQDMRKEPTFTKNLQL